jgi:hypothetical protein
MKKNQKYDIRNKSSGREGPSRTHTGQKQASIAQENADMVDKVMTPNSPGDFVESRTHPARALPAPQGGEHWGGDHPMDMAASDAVKGV